MINPKELRIGNYIYVDTGVPVMLHRVEAKDIYDIAEGKIIQRVIWPIILTSEWLLRFDFVKNTSMCIEEREIWSIQVGNTTSLYFDSIHKSKKWYLSHEWNNNHFQNDFWNCPEYVHQLQNLYFALTAYELTNTY